MFSFDLVRRPAILGELAGDDDAVTIFFVFVCVFALILERDRDLRRALYVTQWIAQTNHGATHAWPSRMNDLRPEPRPVTLAFPPSATVKAERTALLPPDITRLISMQRVKFYDYALPL